MTTRLTAGLDLDQVIGTGSVGSFTTTLTGFKALAAGSTQTFTISLGTNAAGAFSATYELKFSDEDLAGAINLESLWVQANGSVVAVPEPTTLCLLGLAEMAVLFCPRQQTLHSSGTGNLYSK